MIFLRFIKRIKIVGLPRQNLKKHINTENQDNISLPAAKILETVTGTSRERGRNQQTNEQMKRKMADIFQN